MKSYRYLTGLTGQPVHSGSWLGLPDFGVTEAISNLIGGGKTAQGGSNLSGRSPTVSGNAAKTGGNILGVQTQVPTGVGPGPNPYVSRPQTTTSNTAPTQQGSQAPNTPSIDDLFNPVFGYLDQLTGSAQNTANQMGSDLQNSYNQLTGLIPGQEQSLRQGVQNSLDQVNKTAGSAYDQAVRTYNALRQQAQSMYGSQNSAGGALTDLAQQQLLQGEGDIGNALQSGVNTLSKEGTDIGNWVAQKKTDLDSWFSQAKEQINGNLQQTLSSINGNRAMTEYAKTNAKQELLSQILSQNAAIEQADRAFRQQLTLYTLPQGQGIAGTAFNNSPYTQELSQYLGNLNNVPNTLPAQTALGSNAGSLFAQFAQPGQGQNRNDVYNQLLGASANPSSINQLTIPSAAQFFGSQQVPTTQG